MLDMSHQLLRLVHVVNLVPNKSTSRKKQPVKGKQVCNFELRSQLCVHTTHTAVA